MLMHRYGDSLWGRFLRWLMPANGVHAKPEETGELPVYEEYSRFPAPWLRETNYDLPLVRPYMDKAA